MKRLVVFLAVLAVGCGSSGVVRLGGSVPAPKPPNCPLMIYADAEDVKRPFEKVCLIDAKTGSTLYNDRSPEGAMRKVRAAACQCGADAILLSAMEKKGVSFTGWGSSSAKAIAIRYTGPPENAATLAASYAPGTHLYRKSGGALFATVLGREKEHRFPDGRTAEALRVGNLAGAEGWITLEEAAELDARMD